MSIYRTPASGRLWVPSDDAGNPEIAQAVSQIEALGQSDPLVSADDSRVLVDELMYSDGSLQLRALFGEWFVSLDVPLRPNDDLRGLLRKVNRAFDVTSRESGYYLSNDDVALVDTFTPDGQGRITVGRDYADRKIRVIVTDA